MFSEVLSCQRPSHFFFQWWTGHGPWVHCGTGDSLIVITTGEIVVGEHQESGIGYSNFCHCQAGLGYFPPIHDLPIGAPLDERVTPIEAGYESDDCGTHCMAGGVSGERTDCRVKEKWKQ